MIEPTFESLGSVGYTVCAHPRMRVYREHRTCLDCGATWAWAGGRLGKLLRGAGTNFTRIPIADPGQIGTPWWPEGIRKD